MPPRKSSDSGTSDAGAADANRPAAPAPPVSPDENRRLVGWRGWLVRAVLMIAAPAAVLGLLEAGLWLGGYGHPTDFFIPSADGSRWTTNERFGLLFCPPATAPEPEPASFAAVKPAGVQRIFVLGESAATGTPDPSYGFWRVLEVMLRERHPGVRFEVVDAAVIGLDSHAIRAIAAACARHRPDLFVIYMGNNEFVGPCGPLGTGVGRLGSPALVRAGLAVKATRTGQLAVAALGGLCGGGAERQTIDQFLAHAMPASDLRRTVVREAFRANVDAILDVAADAGARVVISTVATNLRDCPPLASLHAADLTDADRADVDRLLAAGATAERDGRLADAIGAYEDAVDLDEDFAESHFRLGRALAGAGRVSDARRHGRRARDLDALPFRATSKLNSAIRQVAAQRPGVRLVDAAAAFEASEEAPGGLPGDILFYEHAHMTFRGNYRLAATLLPAVEAALGETGLAKSPAEAVPSRERCEQLLGLTLRDRTRMAMTIAGMTGKPPFTNQSDHAGQQQRLRRQIAGLMQALAAQDPRAEAGLRAAALDRAPDDWRLHHATALARFDVGDFAAAERHWRHVLEQMPEHLEARVRLARTLVRRGLLEEAGDLYAAALRQRPECLQARVDLAALRLLQGRLPEAADATAKALAIRPDPQGYLVLGDVALRQGDRPGAAAAWRQGLERFPECVPLHVRLGEAMLDAAEYAEAAAQFDAALRTEPDNDALRCRLAAALAGLGKTEEAAGQYRLALARNARRTEALEALRRLTGSPASDPVLMKSKMANYR